MSKKQAEAPKTEVAVAESGLPAEYSGDWGASEGLEMSDVLIPKIFLMQGMSDFVMNGEAKIGEFRDSIDGSLLTDNHGNLDVIVFDSFKTWQVFEVIGEKRKFARREDYTMDTANLPYEWTEGGKQYHRDKVFHFYCLLPHAIEDLPYVLSLSRTNTQAAKQLSTIFAKLQRMKHPSAAVVVTLTARKTENEKGIFFVIDAKQARRTENDELAIAKGWYNEIRAGKTKFRVDEDEKPKASGPVGYNGQDVIFDDDGNPI